MQRTWVLVAAVAVATAIAGFCHYAGVSAIVTFVVATAALAGLAWIVSFSTEQVGGRLGPAATGVLQSTLGNLPEFFIVLFALHAGEVVVAQTSLVGSILANALLVLGAVILAGCRSAEDGVMRFKPQLPRDNATLMLLGSFLIVMVGISTASDDPASKHVQAISVAGAIALLATYTVWIVDYMRSDVAGEEAAHEPRVPMSVSVALLAVGGVGAAFVSDWFIAALTPTIDRLGISRAFAGLVIVAIAGNAVENTAGIVLAAKNKSDLAISVVKNSVAQVTAFLFPALVLTSLLFTHRLTFQLAPIYIGALLLTGLALWQTTADGEATRFEGVALVSLFAILAVTTFYE